jgi:hypothetical protein
VAAAAAAMPAAATTTKACTSPCGEAPGHPTVVIAAESTRALTARAARLRIAASGIIAPAKRIGRGASALSSALGTRAPGPALGTAISATVAEAATRGLG